MYISLIKNTTFENCDTYIHYKYIIKLNSSLKYQNIDNDLFEIEL